MIKASLLLQVGLIANVKLHFFLVDFDPMELSWANGI